MLQVLGILFGAGFTVAVSLALGKLLLRRLGVQLYRQEEHVFAFLTGAACLSTVVFALAAIHAVWPAVFLAVGLVALGAAARRGAYRPAGQPLPRASWPWQALFWTVFAVFTFLYAANAMAPEVSPDGGQYHLGLVVRYLLAHGFYNVSSTMYSYLPQATEMLYLFAFAFGRHSAAAMVHLAFLVTLPLAMMLYGRRFGFARAGLTGAVLVYVSPIVGWDGTTAYIDVALACVLFGMFYLLQIWDQERQPRLLILIGLLAGFACAIKYTAVLAVPYALGFVLWRSFRKTGNLPAVPGFHLAGASAVMFLPWLVKNWLQTGNPLAPFFNRWFPNPYVHINLERGYLYGLAHWNGLHFWQTPLEVTIRGDKVQGVLGIAFLLAPLALLALRYRQGRRLLLAALLFAAAYPFNLGTRFLIPMLPFLALALALVLANWKAMAPLVAAGAALSSWPAYLGDYCDQYAPRLDRIPIEAALRIEPEEQFLERRKGDYLVSRMIEEKVPPGARVFALSAPPMAYHTREVLGSYECAESNNLFDMVRLAEMPGWLPTRRLLFHFPPQPLRALRVRQIGKTGQDWSIAEFRVFSGSRELPRGPRWRLRASPNPREVQMAFDNSLVTRWRAWQPLAGREYVAVDFGVLERVETVVLETPRDERTQLRLEGRDAAGPWRLLAWEPRVEDVPEPADLRRSIARELRWEGIEYLLAWDFQGVGKDLRQRTAEWGLTLAGERNGARLYHVE